MRNVKSSGSKNPLVSVVIPTRNEEDALGKLLNSLERQTYKRYDVIVVDGGSTDGTVKIAKKHGAMVITEYGRYKSPANARNIGVEKADGDIVAVLDCDSEVNERFLEEAVKTFDSSEVKGVMCSYRLAEDTLVEKILASKIKTHKPEPGTPAFTRKGFLMGLGGWDASLGYGEDRVIVGKITKYNAQHGYGAIKHAVGSVVTSHLPHTLAELSAQQRWYGRTMPHFLKKNGAKEYLALLRVFYVLVPVAVLMALFQAAFWLPALLVSIPFILLSLYRTAVALARGKVSGLGIFFIDIFMGYSFTRGLFENLFRKERGRD